jgi:phosphoglycolate phosphatase
VIGPFALACLDMAGTTVRDDGVVDLAFTRALAEVGVAGDSAEFEAAQAYVHRTMGQSKAEVFAALLEPERAARATAAFAAAYEAIVAGGGISPMPGAPELFEHLRAHGVLVCLTTGFAPSTRDAIIGALDWSGRIDLALSPADVGRGRPAPDMILGAMARLGVTDPAAVVVVGDTTSDLEAGSAARAGAVIGVLSGAHDRATLAAAPHTHLITDISHLIHTITALQATYGKWL